MSILYTQDYSKENHTPLLCWQITISTYGIIYENKYALLANQQKRIMEIVVVHSIGFKNRYEKYILFGCLYRGYLNVQEKTPKRLTVDAPSKNESSQRLQNFDFVRK